MTRRAAFGLNFVIWGFVIWAQVWATQHGSPQHVWWFCDMLGWCTR